MPLARLVRVYHNSERLSVTTAPPCVALQAAINGIKLNSHQWYQT